MILKVSNMKYENRIRTLINLGYKEEDIEKIVDAYPLNNMRDDTLSKNIKNNYNTLVSLGYSIQDVIKMTKTLPALFGYSEESIKHKIEYLRKINLDFIVREDTRQLIQSVELTYARHEYFKNEKGETITEETYRKLFYGSKVFKKIYGITNGELIEKYNYNTFENDCIKK